MWRVRLAAPSPKSSMSSIAVRPLKTGREFRACEEIQREVWGQPACSAELLRVTQKYGGALLGAFHGRDAVGFLFAFLARRRGKLIHWSHMMGCGRVFATGDWACA